MRKPILVLAGGAALFLIACLVAPDEPSGRSESALSCGGGERAFNGSCRAVCTTSSMCKPGSQCMHVGAGVALCLNYTHCAFLSSDTKCGGAAGGYSAYGGPYGWADYGYGAYSYPGAQSAFYAYGGVASTAGCAGDATWTTILPNASAPIQCGTAHSVTRCAPVAPGQCGLVTGTTNDVADP